MLIEDLAESRCCGCAACANVCASGAIQMAENQEGFLYPVINHKLCVGCGACDRACPRLNESQKHGKDAGNILSSNGCEDVSGKFPVAYGAICNSTSIRDKSSSGGVFRLLAEKILRQGGAVYGAAFDENWEVCHCRIDNIDDIEKLQGSKYVQSRVGKIFCDVRKQLAGGRPVLFSGTPCQCEGLRCYLGKDFNNLYIVDFVCHGVPSPAVWRSYVQYVAGLKKDTTISHIFFRSKNLSWERFLLEFIFANSSKYRNDLYTDIYLRGFLQDLYLRKSCYQCTSRKRHRVSDVTVADFWGVQNVLPDMYDGRGTSLVLVQSEKGSRLFEGIDARVAQVNFAEAIRGNPAYFSSPAMHPKRRVFFQRFYSGEPFMPLLEDILREPFAIRLKSRLRSIKILRDIYHCIRN
ncbi:MAG: Coenzyme F420 hydrogenase/dehydrogenase, beta subunit C-terminal domain [Anaerovibrio sp.]